MTNQPPNFESLYEAYKDLVFNTAAGYVQNIGDAEEITQDVFTDVYFGLENFKGQSSLKTWIYRITVNRCIDFLKHKNRKKRFAYIIGLFHKETGAPAYDPPDFEHPGVLAERREATALIFKNIRLLPENQQTAFILSKLEGLSNIEIGEIMELKIGAVESLQSRAKENLKKKLSEYFKN